MMKGSKDHAFGAVLPHIGAHISARRQAPRPTTVRRLCSSERTLGCELAAACWSLSLAALPSQERCRTEDHGLRERRAEHPNELNVQADASLFFQSWPLSTFSSCCYSWKLLTSY